MIIYKSNPGEKWDLKFMLLNSVAVQERKKSEVIRHPVSTVNPGLSLYK